MSFFKKFLTSALGLLLILLSFTNQITVKAETGFSVTALTFTDNAGNPITNVYSWSNMKISINFKLENNHTFVKDSTTTISLPSTLKLSNNQTFNVTNTTNDVIAVATLDAVTKTITLTYTDFVTKNSNITGNLYIQTQVDTNVVKVNEKVDVAINIEGQTTPIGSFTYVAPTGENKDEEFGKNSWFQNQGTENVESIGILRINEQNKTLSDVVIKDQLRKPDFEYKSETLKIFKGTWALVEAADVGGALRWRLQNRVEVTGEYPVVYGSDDKGPFFSIELGDITTGFEVEYRVKPNHTLVNGEVLLNYASMHAGETVIREVTREVTHQVSGGGAVGYVYTVNVNKTGPKGQPMSGVVFEVIRQSTQERFGTFETNAQGQGFIDGLLYDTYVLNEIVVPEGYQKRTGFVVNPEDFDSELQYTLDITNELLPISIPVTKIWADNENQDGIRPDSITITLLIDDVVSDQSLVLNEENNWSGLFTNLPVHRDGILIDYTISEQDIDGYISTISGDVASGFVLTNTHNPLLTEVNVSKIWDDNNNQDGLRPQHVLVTLLINGVPSDLSMILNEENNFIGAFTNLPQYQNGELIEYSIFEQDIEGYTSSVSGNMTDGFVLTNKHNAEMINLSGRKVWVDNNNQAGLRPQDIEVHLVADNEIIRTLKVNQETNWEFEFNNLPKYKEGQVIVYSLEETEVTHYQTSIEGFEITNTLPEVPVVPEVPTTPELPSTGADSSSLTLLGTLVTASGLYLLKKKKEDEE